ncbi:MAG: hypothetical protein N2C14_30180, partial [Planctomycetales bacterium]
PFDEFCADVALAIHELIGIGPFNITRSELTWLTLEILEDMNRREAARSGGEALSDKSLQEIIERAYDKPLRLPDDPSFQEMLKQVQDESPLHPESESRATLRDEMSESRLVELQQLKQKIQEHLRENCDWEAVVSCSLDQLCSELAFATRELARISPHNLTRSETTWLMLEILEDANRRESARENGETLSDKSLQEIIERVHDKPPHHSQCESRATLHDALRLGRLRDAYVDGEKLVLEQSGAWNDPDGRPHGLTPRGEFCVVELGPDGISLPNEYGEPRIPLWEMIRFEGATQDGTCYLYLETTGSVFPPLQMFHRQGDRKFLRHWEQRLNDHLRMLKERYPSDPPIPEPP